MNLNNMLLVNVRTSDYFKVLCDVKNTRFWIESMMFRVKFESLVAEQVASLETMQGCCDKLVGSSRLGATRQSPHVAAASDPRLRI